MKIYPFRLCVLWTTHKNRRQMKDPVHHKKHFVHIDQAVAFYCKLSRDNTLTYWSLYIEIQHPKLSLDQAEKYLDRAFDRWNNANRMRVKFINGKKVVTYGG